MAELPKYRPLGVSIPSIPDVDFVSAGRAQGEVYRSLGKSLDVMVDYVYKRKVAQTKREAAKYAFENPVTAEQIQDAISQGRDIEEIVGDISDEFDDENKERFSYESLPVKIICIYIRY